MIDTENVLDITLHKYQLQAYQSTKRITALISGIQGGKTRIGGLWIQRRIAQYDAPDNTFIIAAPTFKLMEKSTLPWSLKLLQGCGYFDKKYYRFYLNGGGIIWFASMQDDDSCEGATNVEGIWIDEAGKLRLNSWINLLGRSSFRQCPIFISTTPYALNWLYEDIYKPWKRGDRDDIYIVQFRSVDNPYFPKEEYEQQRKTLDPRVFERKYGGTFQKMAGLVYPDIDENNYCDPFKYNRQKYFTCAGVDFGWNNPFAIVVRAMAYDGTYDYQIAEYSKSYVEITDRVEILRQYQKVYGVERFYCDSEDPGQIAMFCNAGIPAIAVEKGPGSIERGIVLHNELIRSNKYKMFRGKSRLTTEEYETYHYPEDEGKELNEKELPIAHKDHLMDCNRYITMSTKWLRDNAVDQKAYKKWKSPLEELKELEFDDIEQKPWYNNTDQMSVI